MSHVICSLCGHPAPDEEKKCLIPMCPSCQELLEMEEDDKNKQDLFDTFLGTEDPV